MSEENPALETPKRRIEEIGPHLLPMLQAVFTAARNVQMYPAESPAARRLVETAYDGLAPMVPDGGCLDISYIEDKMMVNGEAIDDAIQKRGIVRQFHDLMKAKKISSITFWSGMTSGELREFLVLLTAKPVFGEDGEQVEFHTLIDEMEIKHIEIDEQIYVAISKREKVVDARATTEQDVDPALRALKDEVFARFLSGEVLPTEASAEAVQQMMSDPANMIAAVHSFVEAHGWGSDMRGLALEVGETRGILERMAMLLQGVEDPALKSKLSREVERIAGQIEVPQLKEILFGGEGEDLSEALLPVLGDERVAALVEGAVEEYRMLLSSEGDWRSERLESVEAVIREAARTHPELSGKLQEILDEGARGADGGPRCQESDDARSAELARSLIAGADAKICDLSKGPVLVNAAGILCEQGRDDLASVVIGRIWARFRVQPEGSRATAARQITGLAGRLEKMGKAGLLGDLAPEAGEIVRQLDEMRSGVMNIASAALKVDAGEQVKGMQIPDATLNALMTSDTGSLIKAVFATDDPAARESVTRALLQMPDKAIPAMLDAAQESTDGETLGEIARSLKDFKDPTPWISSRFSKEMEPWQLVNMVKLFGLVAGPDSAGDLEPVLELPEAEPHLAAINALADIGGRTALNMLIEQSDFPDPAFQAPALRALARFHDYQAVRRLSMVITPGKKGETTEPDQNLIAACRGLADLNAVPAVGLIVDLALKKKKGARVSDEVRAAAALALGRLGSAEARKALRKLGGDESMLVRSTARKALGAAD